jgi:hypothetical protein
VIFPLGITTNGFFEDYFEARLAQIEPGLIRRVKYRMDRASDLDRNDAMQEVRRLPWRRFSDDPETWVGNFERLAVSPLLPPIAGGDTPHM